MVPAQLWSILIITQSNHFKWMQIFVAKNYGELLVDAKIMRWSKQLELLKRTNFVNIILCRAKKKLAKLLFWLYRWWMNKRYPVQLSALISFSDSNQLFAFNVFLFHKSAFSFVAEFQYHYIHALRSLSQWDLFHSIAIQLSDANDVPSQWTNDVE